MLIQMTVGRACAKRVAEKFLVPTELFFWQGILGCYGDGEDTLVVIF